MTTLEPTTLTDAALWALAVLSLQVAVIAAVLGIVRRTPLIGAVGVLPVAVALLGRAFGIDPAPVHPTVTACVAVLLAVLAVAAGNPITMLVLSLAEKQSVFGGSAPLPTAIGREEVLRGGAMIGYLERIALVGCVLLGRFEGVAVIIAIKGLGRFSELRTPVAQEKFIIGTLASLTWAGACAAAVLLL